MSRFKDAYSIFQDGLVFSGTLLSLVKKQKSATEPVSCARCMGQATQGRPCVSTTDKGENCEGERVNIYVKAV